MDNKGKKYEVYAKNGYLHFDQLWQVRDFVENNTVNPLWFKQDSLFRTKYLDEVIYGGVYFVISEQQERGMSRYYSIMEIQDTSYLRKHGTFEKASQAKGNAKFLGENRMKSIKGE
jgi:hypothetical protein